MKSLVFLVSLILASAACGQCQNGRCLPNVAAPILIQPLPTSSPLTLAHGWYRHNGGVELYWRGERIGTLEPRSGQWCTNGKAHLVDLVELAAPVGATKPATSERPKQCLCKADACECKDCPSDCLLATTPVFAALPDEERLNYGMDWRGGADKEKCRLSGVETTKDRCIQAISAADIPDDSRMTRVTVIGTESERAAVLKDLEQSPELAPYRGKMVVQAYDPSHWHVRDAGFKTDGHPTIYAQQPDGKVLHRQDSYDGPARLAQALRRIDSAYDPAKDPDLSKPTVKPDDGKQCNHFFGITLLAAMAAAGVGLGVLFARKVK